MEPGHEDREYPVSFMIMPMATPPQWSPVMKTGNTRQARAAAKESLPPQWSPVMKTGNTRGLRRRAPAPRGLNGARS